MPHIEQCNCAHCALIRQASEQEQYDVRVREYKLELLVVTCAYAYWWFVLITVFLGNFFWQPFYPYFQGEIWILLVLTSLVIYLFPLTFLGYIVNSTKVQMHAVGLGLTNPLAIFVFLQQVTYFF